MLMLWRSSGDNLNCCTSWTLLCDFWLCDLDLDLRWCCLRLDGDLRREREADLRRLLEQDRELDLPRFLRSSPLVACHWEVYGDQSVMADLCALVSMCSGASDASISRLHARHHMLPALRMLLLGVVKTFMPESELIGRRKYGSASAMLGRAGVEKMS